MKPRILILSASVGGGHLRAAEAIEIVARETLPQATIRHVDILQMSNRFFRRIYAQTYVDLCNRAPYLYGFLFEMMDRPPTGSPPDRFRQLLQWMNLGTFLRFLREEPWDLVINTHFLPAEIIATLRNRGRLHTPQVTVVTDFDTHSMWCNRPCERYFTPTVEAGLVLQALGVPADNIIQTGIPIHPLFAIPKERIACLRKHGLAEDRPVILQLAGSHGVGPVEALFRALLTVEVPVQLVVVCGRNGGLQTVLERVPVPPRHRVKILGFTREMHELISVAELVVSKPGGLTTAETLASAAVMVIVNPVPGQETRNSDYLLENGAAVKANHPATAAYKVSALLRDRARLEQLRANARQLGRPRAAYEVVERSLELIGGRSSS